MGEPVAPLRCNTPPIIGCQHGPVPNQPKTPVRSFRIRDEVYLPAKAKAKARGENLTEIVIEALVDYVGDEDWSSEEPAPVDVDG